jgi:AsmA protein
MKRTLLITVGAVVLLLLTAAILISFLVDVDSYRPTIEKALAEATGRDVELGPLSLSFLPGPALQAKGVSIGEDARFGDKPFLEADDLSVSVSLLPLLGGRLEVGSLTIESPSVRLHRSGETWNLASLLGGAAEGPATERSGRRAEEKAGFEGPGAGAPAGEAVEDVGDDSGGGTALTIRKVHLDGGRIVLVDEDLIEGRTLKLEARDIDLELTDLSATEPIGVDLAMELKGSGRTRLSGRFGPFAGGGPEGGWPLEADLRLDDFEGGPAVAYLEALTGLRVHGGSLDLDLHMKGAPPGSLEIDGEAALDRLEVDPLFGDGPPVRLDATVSLEGRLNGDETHLTRADLSIGGAKISLAGTLKDLSSDPSLEASITSGQVNVSELLPVLALIGPLVPDGIGPTGRISLDAAVRGSLSRPESLGIEGRATLEGLEYTDPSLREPIRGITGTANLNGERVEITSFAASLGRSRVEGRCLFQGFDQPRIDVTLNAPLLDVDELLAILDGANTVQAVAGRPPTLQIAGMGSRSSGSTPGGAGVGTRTQASSSILRRVSVHGEVTAAEAKLMNLKLSGMRAGLEMTGGEARIRDASLSLYGGRFEGQITAGLAETGPPFSLTAGLEGVDFNAMAADYSPDLEGLLYGSLDASLSLGGVGVTKEQLRRGMEGTASFSLTDGKLTSVGVLKDLAEALESAGGRGVGHEETPFSFLGGTFRVRGGKARTEDLRLESPDITMKGEGKLNLDLDLDLDLIARLSPEVTADMVARREKLRFLKDKKERIKLELQVRGTLMEPAVGVDPDMLKRVLKNATRERLREKGKERLKDLFKKKKKEGGG